MDQAKQNRETYRKDKLFQIGSGRDGFETANRLAVKPALHSEKPNLMSQYHALDSIVAM